MTRRNQVPEPPMQVVDKGWSEIGRRVPRTEVEAMADHRQTKARFDPIWIAIGMMWASGLGLLALAALAAVGVAFGIRP